MLDPKRWGGPVSEHQFNVKDHNPQQKKIEPAKQPATHKCLPVPLLREMSQNFWRGHEIVELNGAWVYRDTKEAVSDAPERACGHCGISPQEGRDACLGKLPGLMNACCGHGRTDDAYVQFIDGFVVGGNNAITIIDILKHLPKGTN